MSLVLRPRNALEAAAMEMQPPGGAVAMPQAYVPQPASAWGASAPFVNFPVAYSLAAQDAMPLYYGLGGQGNMMPGNYGPQPFINATPRQAPQRPAPRPAARPASREMSADQLNALVLGALGGQAPAAQGSANFGADQNIRRFMGY